MTFDQFVQLLNILKWPLVVFILILLAILLFRNQLAAFLSRIESIGKEGLKATPAVNQQNPPDRNKEPISDTLGRIAVRDNTRELEVKGKDAKPQDLMRALNSPVLTEQEQVIKADLEKHGLEHEGETINILVRYLANAQLTVAFEEVYRLIFRSQIQILRRVNESQVLKRSVVEEHFHQTRALFPAAFADWDVDRYMSYLLGHRVLRHEKNDEYAITLFGIEFLAWMARVGATENKPL
jgi:hypothetical protein